MSTVAIVLIVLAVLFILFLIGGLLGARARDRRLGDKFYEDLRAADVALEQARAADKGWHREMMEEAARAAIAESRPGWAYDDLHLVFVDDRPGIDEDRAHFMAMGAGGGVRVIMARQGDRWVAERVE
jgi:type II secretory pathway pseudopilin PulG